MSTNNSEKKVDNKKRLLGFAATGLLALAAIVVCSVLQSLNISGFVWLYQLIIIIACVAGITIHLMPFATCLPSKMAAAVLRSSSLPLVQEPITT